MNKMLKQAICFSVVILSASLIIPAITLAQNNINTIGTFGQQTNPVTWVVR